MKKKKRYPRMSPRAKELAGETVPEELRARRGRKRSQAIAIGLSRAREQAELERALGIAGEYGVGHMRNRGAS